MKKFPHNLQQSSRKQTQNARLDGICKLIPIPTNKVLFQRVKAPKIKDRKWHSIKSIQCDLGSLICRHLSRGLNMTLFVAIGIKVLRFFGFFWPIYHSVSGSHINLRIYRFLLKDIQKRTEKSTEPQFAATFLNFVLFSCSLGCTTQAENINSIALPDASLIDNLSFFGGKDSHPPPPTERGGPYPFVQRLTLSHAEGINAGTGYGTNYTSATAFLAPNYKLGHTLPFIDFRIHRFDNNTYGANLGIGARYIPKNHTFCNLLGFNLYYDYRRGHRWNYNQFGLGVEILGKRLDFRANMYFPFGVKKYSCCCVFDDYIGDWFATNCKCESISYGYNAEVGYLIVRSKYFFLYAATGPYYYAAKCLDRTAGWEVRIRPQYKDYFAIDFKVNYDRFWHTVYQTTFIVSLPLYQIATKKDFQGPCGITDRQIYQPVIRLETIPISRNSCWQTNFDESVETFFDMDFDKNDDFAEFDDYDYVYDPNTYDPDAYYD